MTFTLSTVPSAVTVASRMTTPSTRARLASAGYFGCSMWTTFGCLTLPPTRTGAGGGGGGGTLPPSKPEPVQVEKPELTAPLSVPKDIAKIVDTAPPSGASGARSGVVGGATTGLPGVSVGDVFSTAAWRCGSGALLT